MDNNTHHNPFITNVYQSPEYFCGREVEREKLHGALYNGRNVLLVSPRRMGKTGLIMHTFASVLPQEAYCIYTDIYKTTCLKEFTECLAQAIIGQCGSPTLRERAMQWMQSLRFVFSTDPITGAPTIGVKVIIPEIEVSLAQVFAYMEQADKPVYLAIDEFQQIRLYPDVKVEETLRGFIQHLKNVHIIFAGSQSHMMLEMFSSAKRAFYQSAQTLHIDSLPEDTYYAFCREKFAAHQQILTQDAFHFLYTTVFAHTWYIQAVANRLYELHIPEITAEQVQKVIAMLVEENTFTYQNYCRLFSGNQLRVLRAIATERTVSEPNKQEFLATYNLPAGSSVRAAIKVLVDKEFVYDSLGVLSVYDRFFGIWLVNN